MLRGANTLFTAALSLLLLGRRYNGAQTLGLGLIAVGLCVVGVSEVEGDKSSSSQGKAEEV